MSERISVPSMSTARGMSDTASPTHLAEGGVIQGFADRFNEAGHHLVGPGTRRGRAGVDLENAFEIEMETGRDGRGRVRF